MLTAFLALHIQQKSLIQCLDILMNIILLVCLSAGEGALMIPDPKSFNEFFH